MDCSSVITSLHAVKRMVSRSIMDYEVKTVIKEGEIIRQYPDDKPNPSMLLHKVINGRPIHVVVGRSADTNVCVVITVYIADEEMWEMDFKTKKK
jgi:hypothetical protein